MANLLAADIYRQRVFIGSGYMLAGNIYKNWLEIGYFMT